MTAYLASLPWFAAPALAGAAALFAWEVRPQHDTTPTRTAPCPAVVGDGRSSSHTDLTTQEGAQHHGL